MKDETKGVPIVEFVGLRSKMYSYRRMKLLVTMKLLVKRQKKLKKNIVKNVIKYEDKKILFNNDQMYHKMD